MRRAPNPWDRFYASHIAPWRGEREVADILPLLGEGPVLELGVGNGKALTPLRRAGVTVVGLDISFHALRRLGSGVLADARKLPFGSGTFTAVLDLHCTGHLDADGRAAALAEARRVCRRGGRLVQERLGPGDLRAARAQHGVHELADGRRTWFLGQEELQREAAAARWTDIVVSQDVRTPRVRDARVRREHLRLVAYAT